MQFNRFTASGLHLAISATIALAVIIGMKLVWYPDPYFQATGASGLILILVAVDVTIGPLITLVVFNLRKPRLELKRDLSIIALFQIAALLYGIHVVFVARPVYAVFNVNSFDLVVASEIDPGELKKAQRDEFKSLPLWGPQIIAAKWPSDRQESKTLFFSSVLGGADLYDLPRYYVPYEELIQQAKAAAKPLAMLRKKAGGDASVDRFIAKSGYQETQLGFVPLRGKRMSLSVVLRRDNGKVVGFLPIDPF
jgi:hypothetical protein